MQLMMWLIMETQLIIDVYIRDLCGFIQSKLVPTTGEKIRNLNCFYPLYRAASAHLVARLALLPMTDTTLIP